jgi:hypothetical protein
VTTGVGAITFLVPDDWLVRWRYTTVSVPVIVKFYYDALVLTYDIRQYWGDSNYWVAIPIATIISYYLEY